ncbi:MAG: DegT/DnrJ/EryC1/StrS family aminotransferase [Phycisphaerae bacterium]|nr:DegT/DnrJ/EryC1/StrS family aminotransferase [Phycisphaerae bacterium]
MGQLAINGGKKSCDHQWPGWPIWGDEERKGLNEVLESGQWWYGEKVRQFEEAFAAFQGARYGITACNGTVALEVVLATLGVGAGDEVIVPPYTFVATASAVLRVNAIPVFADILPENLCIDPSDVERKITDKTKAIMPVHFGGHVADMDVLDGLAAKRGIPVIEDACHSWGSQWKSKGTGAIGRCGVFSFQASKNISGAEGGIILTDDEDLAERCRSYTNCGRKKDKPWYEHYMLGSNLRLTEFQAAILLAQLTRLESQTLKRQANAAILDEALKGTPGITVLTNDPRMTRRSYHMYAFRIRSDELGVSREKFIEALVAEGLPASMGYPIPLYKNPLCQKSGTGPAFCPTPCPYYGREVDYTKVCCPVCEDVCSDAVWLPQAFLLADEQAIRDAASAIKKVCENVGELR